MAAVCPTSSDLREARFPGLAASSRHTQARPPRPVLAARLAFQLTLWPRAALALRDWCRLHDIGAGEVVAERRAMPIAPRPENDVLEWLALAPGESPSHRRMRLRRGEVAVASCDLWWLPGRMARPMQAAFEAEVLPEGAMLQLLSLRRRILVEAQPAEGPCLFERRGVIIAADGVPVAAFRDAFRADLFSGEEA